MLYRPSYRHLNVFRVVSLMQGQSCHYVPLRGRWTRERSKQDSWVRKLIRNRCSSGQQVRQSWRERHTNRGDVWVYKRPPVVLSETDDLEGQSWAYTPLWLSLSETTRRLRNDLGGIFWGVACGVIESTGIQRHIPFKLPIKLTNVKRLLCVTPGKLWSMVFFQM